MSPPTYTPWLSQAENLSLLADTLSLGELQLEGTEVPVGNFYIDILARDEGGGVVVIENQFGPTDHTHLGQIMTYLAGQEGKVTVVWVAEQFREEHRAVIDWLNANTIEGFDFFAAEVEVLKIGESIPAPWFNVVAKPNGWSRNVRGTRSGGNGALDERQKAYSAYWSAFRAFLEDQRASFKFKTASPRDYWCGFHLGRPGFGLVALASFRDHYIGVQIYIDHPAAKIAFDSLLADRTTIEADFGGPLEWDRKNAKKATSIAVFRRDLDPNKREQWPEQFRWIFDQMSRFTRALSERIKRLDLGAASTSEA